MRIAKQDGYLNSKNQEQLEAQQLELATVKKERNRLEGNHEITKEPGTQYRHGGAMGARKMQKTHGENDMTY